MMQAASLDPGAWRGFRSAQFPACWAIEGEVEDFHEPWYSGPEMQLLDDAAHPDGRVPETRCGALYALYPPVDAPPCAPGRFHTARVCLKGTQVEHWLEGVRVLACDLASADFRERVSRSKFSGLPQFARSLRGHLVLQHHGEEAWFRRVRIVAA